MSISTNDRNEIVRKISQLTKKRNEQEKIIKKCNEAFKRREAKEATWTELQRAAEQYKYYDEQIAELECQIGTIRIVFRSPLNEQ